MLKTKKKECAKISLGGELSRSIAVYTILFFLILLIGYSALWLHGKTLLWETDELTQAYPAFVYTGVFFRKWVHNILGGIFAPPLFDLSIGLGADALLTMNYAGFGDPILAVFSLLPLQFAPVTYTIATVARLYLIGIAFVLYAREIDCDSVAQMVIGSLTYTFCGHAFVYATVFSSYLAPMMYLPIMLIGFERAFQKRKPWMMSAAVVYGALCGFYTLYMCTIFLVPYGLVRGAYLHGSKWKEILLACLRALRFYVYGALMAAPVLLPMVYMVMNNTRSTSLGVDLTAFWQFDLSELTYVFPNGLLSQQSYAWEALALPCLIIPAVSVLMVKRGRSACFLKATVLAVIVLICVPGVTQLLDGMGANVSIPYRWNFLISFVLSCVLMLMIPNLLHMSPKEGIAALVGTLAYLGYAFLITRVDSGAQVRYVAIILGMSICCLFAVQIYLKKDTVKVAVLFALLIVNIAHNIDFFYSPTGWGMAEKCAEMEDVQNIFARPVQSFQTISQDKTIYRVSDEYAPEGIVGNNLNIVNGTNGLAAYWSMINELLLLDLPETGESESAVSAWSYNGMDGRSGEETLAAVKYAVLHAEQLPRAPYGYERREDVSFDGEIYCLLENTNALPIGWFYNKTVSAEEYMPLNPLQRQEVKLQALVLSEGMKNNADVNLWEEKVPVKVLNAHDMRQGVWENGVIDLFWWSGSLELKFDVPENCETYICLRGVSSPISNEITMYADEYPEMKATSRNAFEKKEDLWFCLGYSENARTGAVVDFAIKEQVEDFSRCFTLEGIEVYSLSMEPYQQYVNQLREAKFENVEFKNNQLTGTINAKEEGYLFVSVPYSLGWKAEIDGKNEVIEKANVAYMAVPVDAGQHQVNFRYNPPGMNTGFLLSGVTVFLSAFEMLKGISLKGKEKYKKLS